jgi:serine/threonine protein kinase/tetratricopeptide (TPR) repeat protein
MNDKAETHRKSCPSCKSSIGIESAKDPVRYCPQCGVFLAAPAALAQLTDSLVTAPSEVKFSIGPYRIIDTIGKGGMGEVLLAYDTRYKRKIALKRVRTDIKKREKLLARFSKEALLTSQLTHPSIIPIYSIYRHGDLLYYTMPYVEGRTLKQILIEAHSCEKKGKKSDEIGGTIPSLIRIFMAVCHAVAYAHSKGVLHRDLKPENIIVGNYGEVLILDWGLAKMIQQAELDETEDSENETDPTLTMKGKAIGTVQYMAPETAIGLPASIQSDIYALGTILYQILTLRNPYQRKDIKSFRKNIDKEVLPDPSIVAPYRDVPVVLTHIVRQCLCLDPSQRYLNVTALINEVESYLEGRSDWFQMAELDVKKKSDWEFQENIFFPEAIAISNEFDLSSWMNLMLSQQSFSENVKIDIRLKLKQNSQGIGILLCVPEPDERRHLNEGYCLWLAPADSNNESSLLRSGFQVMNIPETSLVLDEYYDLRLIKFNEKIHFYLNRQFQFSYISPLPLVGTHVGLLAKDGHFAVEKFSVSMGSRSITINCLAVPDAFLADKNYDKALTEYRRIGYAFPGRAEGREALFRAGITLLEQAKASKDPEAQAELWNETLNEFDKLHNTPGAPLEYLGKALVYQTLENFDEEIKCYELSLRRYRQHPLLPLIQEHITYRLHQASHQRRYTTYCIGLVALRHFSQITDSLHSRKLFEQVRRHREVLFFIEKDKECDCSRSLNSIDTSIQLAFWLSKPWTLSEILGELYRNEHSHPELIANTVFCLIELGAIDLAKEQLEALPKSFLASMEDRWTLLRELTELSTSNVGDSFSKLMKRSPDFNKTPNSRQVLYLLDFAIENKMSKQVKEMIDEIDTSILSEQVLQQVNLRRIWNLLQEKNFDEAKLIFDSYSFAEINKQNSLLHYLYGVWLWACEGKTAALTHFSGTLETYYPRTWALGVYYLTGKITARSEWNHRSFLWEKRQLYGQLALHAFCIGDTDRYDHFLKEKAKQYISIDEAD